MTGGCLDRVVDRELHWGEEGVPVSMASGDVGPHDFLHHPVDSLGLAVGLGVKGGRKGEFSTE